LQAEQGVKVPPVQAVQAELQTVHELGAVPVRYLPTGQLKHPLTPAREQVVQVASQLAVQCPYGVDTIVNPFVAGQVRHPFTPAYLHVKQVESHLKQ
jgi:hypothetical protein